MKTFIKYDPAKTKVIGQMTMNGVGRYDFEEINILSGEEVKRQLESGEIQLGLSEPEVDVILKIEKIEIVRRDA